MSNHLVATSEVPPRCDRSVRLLSLNVAHGRRTAAHQALLDAEQARRNISEVGRVLRQVGPDVIALQEADGPSAWSGNFDHVADFSRHVELDHHVRGDHNPFGNRRYPLASGTALLSAWPLDAVASHPFGLIWRDTKGFVVAAVDIPHWDLEIDVVSVHLDFLRPTVRRRQILRMVEAVWPRQRPLVVLGDLNCSWQRDPASLRLLGDTLGVYPYEPTRALPTFPAHRPRRRLDWILVSRGLTFDAYHTLRTPLSDHLGIVADIRPEPGFDGTRGRSRRRRGGGRYPRRWTMVAVEPGEPAPPPFTTAEPSEEDTPMRPIVARDLMSPEVLTVRDEWDVSRLASFFGEHRITGAPVEDAEGFVVGVVSVVDIVRDLGVLEGRGSYLHVPDRLIDDLPEVRLVDDAQQVRDIMTPDALSVDPEASVSDVASMMLRHHLHRLLVVEKGSLVGIISTSDLLGLLIDE
ncbi:MAG: CBS domain-containing protein [Acidobacteriota bacterium]